MFFSYKKGSKNIYFVESKAPFKCKSSLKVKIFYDRATQIKNYLYAINLKDNKKFFDCYKQNMTNR